MRMELKDKHVLPEGATVPAAVSCRAPGDAYVCPCTRSGAAGFSALELMVVIAIIIVVVGISIPTIYTVVANIKLRGAASDVAGLMQQARIIAVQKNATYSVVFGTIAGGAPGAFVDLNNNGTWNAGPPSEPTIQLPRTVSQVAAPSGSGGQPTTLDSTVGFTANTGNISYNARGLPCDVTSTPCATGVGYIYYLNDTRAFGQTQWAAVSITAAGRVKTWYWYGSSWGN